MILGLVLFGLALSPVFIALINKHLDANADWDEALYFCAAAFVISGLHCLGLDAARSVA